MDWTKESVHALVSSQQNFFRTGETLDVRWRLARLKDLKAAILSHEDLLVSALREDLGRSAEEAYLCDVGPVILEIGETIRGLRRWARPETHFSGLLCFPSVRTKVYKMPYGVSLIISPFNFPMMLSLGVLAAAIAGGNTAVIKASSKSPACTRALREMLSDVFPPEYVSVVDGGHDVGDLCLAERFDKIFYTGSPRVAKKVMSAAAENLTPVALELGGETGNWAIVRKDADIRDAARKIAFFKLCNSGQICIDVNQVAVAEEVAPQFLEELKAQIARQIGSSPLGNPEYPHLITGEAYRKCADEAELYRERIVFGGSGDPETFRYEPTLIYPVSAEEPIVCHELFSPLLPVVPFRDGEIDDLLDVIASREHGLALYLFKADIAWVKSVFASQQYGGGCINEVCMQLMVKGVPFNGTGHSGMGAYHGEWGFREFTHPSTVLIGSPHFNLPLREHPYSGRKNAYKLRLMKFFER